MSGEYCCGTVSPAATIRETPGTARTGVSGTPNQRRLPVSLSLGVSQVEELGFDAYQLDSGLCQPRPSDRSDSLETKMVLASVHKRPSRQ